MITNKKMLNYRNNLKLKHFLGKLKKLLPIFFLETIKDSLQIIHLLIIPF